MERTPGASSSLCVFSQKIDKFQFTANDMRTVRGRFLTTKRTAIRKELVQTCGENCIDVSNVWRWKRDFENNHHISVKDE